MIKAVLFDMNGVIIDDEHIHELAFAQTVRNYNINLSHRDYLLCCAGKTDRKGYEDIAQLFNVDLDIDLLLREKSKIYLDLFPKYKKAYDGVIDLIKKLSQEYTLALTSSSSRSEIDLVVSEFDISANFTLTISADDVQNGKPDPEPYIKTARLLNVETESCVVIEDSPNGIRSAKSAGCYCIAITTTHGKNDLCEANAIIDAFSQIDQNFINDIEK